MKLLLDAGVPVFTCNLLRELGHDVVHANEINLGASDESLLELARREGRVVVTLDIDFHSILAEQGASSPSVIRLRIQKMRHEEAARLIQKLATVCAAELNAGAAISANRLSFRIRQLPLR